MDLAEALPDHSSLTRIRDRYGLATVRRFFDGIVERCDRAGLVWGKELFFDATKVEANASLESVAPRFADELTASMNDGSVSLTSTPTSVPSSLPEAVVDVLTTTNSQRHDWLAEDGRQQRDVMRRNYQRIADFRASATDPDASLMRSRTGGTRLGYHTHYVVDGGKARIILTALVTPSEVMENQPMLDLLWHTRFRWRVWPHHVTADTAYGTLANIVAIEDAHIRAYLPVCDANKREPLFGQHAFTYDADHDRYRCPQGEMLRVTGHLYTERTIRYQAPAAVCNACPVKAQCTTGTHGRQVYRNFDEAYLDRVRAYHETEPYKKAMRKRKVWIEPGAHWAALGKRRIGTDCDGSDYGGYARSTSRRS